MSKIIDLFANDELSLFFDTEVNKLVLKNSNIYYNIEIRTNEFLNLEGKLNDLTTSLNEIILTGSIGPVGPSGARGKQGIQGEKGDKGGKGDQGLPLNIKYYCDSENDMPDECKEGELILIKNKFDLYIKKNGEYVNLGNFKEKGDKGNKGDKGDKGDKGNKGDRGNNFISHFVSNLNELNEITNPENDDIALVNNTLDLYKFDKNWINLGKLISVKGDKGEKGDKGLSGKDGKSFKIDFIINDLEELLDKIDQDNTFAIEKNSLNLYYNKNKKWILLGNNKGEKGDKGEKGSVGEKGDIGDGLKIDYYFDNLEDLLKSEDKFDCGKIIYIKDKNELKYCGIDSIKDLGKLFPSKISTMNLILIPVSQSHQDIDSSNLVEIKHDLDDIELKSFHKLKIIFSWKVVEEVDINFYKEGLLFFAEHNNELVKNSVQFIQGFPFLNTFNNEFIINNLNLKNIRFFIKINDNSGSIELEENYNYLEIENI